MTAEEIRMALALDGCVFLPASFDKRFARGMADIVKYNPEFNLTERQAITLRLMVYRYRRQIKDTEIIPTAEEAGELKERRRALAVKAELKGVNDEEA